MDEYNLPTTWEHQIGLSRQIPPVEAVAIPCNMKRPADCQLRLRIFRANAGHASTALFRCEKIHHPYSRFQRIIGAATVGKNRLERRVILSLFSGCGGLDLGFEAAGFQTALAFDLRPHSVASWNRNRPMGGRAHVGDVTQLTPAQMDDLIGSRFAPAGVIGGPPCQSFTRANHFRVDDDPRSQLVRSFFTVALSLHETRSPLDFIVMENVQELEDAENGALLNREIDRLEAAGFSATLVRLNAKYFEVPQNRLRLFIVAINRAALSPRGYAPPLQSSNTRTVRDAIYGLNEPVYFRDAAQYRSFPHHPNHWCMTPQSRRFRDGSLKPGQSGSRSFKTLSWDQPSIAVSYGHREVHVHPNGRRRLSIFEAMRLQGFPETYVLEGTLSAQVDQVSEAVPPPLAEAVARSVRQAILAPDQAVGSRPASSLKDAIAPAV